MINTALKIIKKNRIGLLLVLLLLFYSIQFALQPGSIRGIIKSDGDGYYAYLPAYFLYNDKTFVKNKEVKEDYKIWSADYMIKTGDDSLVNKYFAGVSIVFMPIFFFITFVLKALGKNPDGYSLAYTFGVYFYSLVLFVISFFSYKYIIEKEFGVAKNHWIFIVLFFTTPWFVYTLYSATFANTVLFPVFILVYWIFLRLIQVENKQPYLFLLAFLIGLIAIIRPTSLFVLLFFLYFFDSIQSFWSFLKEHVLKFKILVPSIFLMVIPAFYQFYMWYWQTGQWFLWSYSGEGFYWLKPELFEVMFSYRIGVLFHSPILIIALVSAILFFRGLQRIIYLLYFFLTVYVSASWWCYDFETYYGLRNFSEHYVFLLFPLFHLITKVKSKIWYFFILVSFILSFIRFNQFMFKLIKHERHNASTYWKSLGTWSIKDNDRWYWSNSVRPYGGLVEQKILVNHENILFTDQEEFYKTKTFPIDIKNGEKIYVKATFTRNFDLKDKQWPLLIVDMLNEQNEKIRNYSTYELFRDKRQQIESVELSGWHVDNRNEYNKISIYFWNLEKIEGKLEDLVLTYEKYK